MDKLEAISIKLQPKEMEVLKKYYSIVSNQSSQHFFWENVDNADDLRDDYSSLKALDALGFVELEIEENSRNTVYTSCYLTLFPSAIYRAQYDAKSNLNKFAIKTYLNYKEWIAMAGFLLSLFLFILRIYELFKV